MLAVALLAERRAYLEANADDLDRHRQAPGGRQWLRPGPGGDDQGPGSVESECPAPTTAERASTSARPSCPPTCASRPRSPRCYRSCTCAGSRPATSPCTTLGEFFRGRGRLVSVEHQPAHRGLPGRARRMERPGPLWCRLASTSWVDGVHTFNIRTSKRTACAASSSWGRRPRTAPRSWWRWPTAIASPPTAGADVLRSLKRARAVRPGRSLSSATGAPRLLGGAA